MVWYLQKIVYEYNINFIRAINKSPVKELLGQNVFNIDENLHLNNNKSTFAKLTDAEREEICIFN